MTAHVPPIEPLSELTWARIEREVWEQLADLPDETTSRAPARRWWLIAPMIAFPVVVAVLALRATADHRERNAVSLESRSSTVELSLDDLHVALEPHSALTISEDPAAPRATLERGAAWLAIAPRPGRAPLVATAGDATLTAVEGRFRIAREADELVVDVERGRVEIRFEDCRVIVGPAARWSSRDPGTVSPLATGADPVAASASGRS